MAKSMANTKTKVKQKEIVKGNSAKNVKKLDQESKPATQVMNGGKNDTPGSKPRKAKR